MKKNKLSLKRRSVFMFTTNGSKTGSNQAPSTSATGHPTVTFFCVG